MKRNLHVTPYEQGWAIKREGEDTPQSTYESETAAVEQAERLASRDEVNVIIHREDGTFRSVRNYSNGNSEAGSPPKLDVKDVVAVGSRVSWSALLAGAVIALTTYIALSFLGIAVGLTVSPRVEGEGLARATLVWAAVSLFVSLFLGGFVTSRTTVGENRSEALTYGLLLWGFLFLLLFFLSGMGLEHGFGSALAGKGGGDRAATRGLDDIDDETLADAGLTETQMGNLREAVREARSATEGMSATATAWWAFGILLGSMITSMLGAMVGAGPELVLRRILDRRAAVVRTSLRAS